ncbi:MAG: hypothetical protein LBL31_04320 [Spirochaetaceae bacterium]|jgi:hypothetical protein|nr:hypothetical protein [Spirochaetaceae bacterium]
MKRNTRGRLLAVLLLVALSLSAQESFSFQTETARLREAIASARSSPRQKHDLLVELAGILQLSGDNEAAAAAWKDAAAAVPGERDERAILEMVACLMAVGEWDEASNAVRLVLLTSRDAPVMLRAKYLGAQIEAFTKGDTVALEFYLEDPDYAPLKPAIYYTLYITTRNETYKSRLIAEFPASPETRLLTDDATPFPGAMWLLYPGRENITIHR